MVYDNDAQRRGVAVRLIADDVKVGHEGSCDVREIATPGIPVVTDQDMRTHMHHKFAVFDKHLLVNGSLNWTQAATTENHENIIVTDDPSLVKPFGCLVPNSNGSGLPLLLGYRS